MFSGLNFTFPVVKMAYFSPSDDLECVKYDFSNLAEGKTRRKTRDTHILNHQDGDSIAIL